MQCGQAHYFSPLCDVGCPCYDDVRVLEDEVWAILFLVAIILVET